MLAVVHDHARKVAVGVPQLLRSLQKLAATDVILPHHHEHRIYLPRTAASTKAPTGGVSKIT